MLYASTQTRDRYFLNWGLQGWGPQQQTCLKTVSRDELRSETDMQGSVAGTHVGAVEQDSDLRLGGHG